MSQKNLNSLDEKTDSAPIVRRKIKPKSKDETAEIIPLKNDNFFVHRGSKPKLRNFS